MPILLTVLFNPLTTARVKISQNVDILSKVYLVHLKVHLKLILTLASIRGLSALDIPWQVYQHFYWFWPLPLRGLSVLHVDIPWQVHVYQHFDRFWLLQSTEGLSALDIPWQVYQHIDWFWPLQSTEGLSAPDIPWQVYQHIDWFWPLQSIEGLSAHVDIPWQVHVYQHFDWFWPLQSTEGLSALDIPWQVYQNFDWFWPLQS